MNDLGITIAKGLMLLAAAGQVALIIIMEM